MEEEEKIISDFTNSYVIGETWAENYSNSSSSSRQKRVVGEVAAPLCFNSENVWQDAGERRRDQQNNIALSFTYVDYIIKCSVCICKEINPQTHHV